jgi:CheY-like chemotaxis protein
MQGDTPILLVEDNTEEVLLMKHAFQAASITRPLVVVHNGQDAAAYLTGLGSYADRKQFPLPRLILLDLDLPHVNGFEFLLWLRERQELRDVPVIVLTGSVFSSVLQTAYSLGANSFLTKPLDIESFITAIRQTCDFWLGPAGLPKCENGLGIEQTE